MKKKIVLLSFILLFFYSLSIFATDWSGTYRWVNPTKKNNGGKVKEIVFEVVSTPSSSFPYEIYSVEGDKRYKICPVYPLGSEGSKTWHEFNEKSSEGEAFRANNKRINTSIFNPSKWMQGDVTFKNNTIKCGITAEAMGMSFEMNALYKFSLDSNGNKRVRFSTETNSDLAKNIMFKNPEKGSDGSFLLEEVK